MITLYAEDDLDDFDMFSYMVHGIDPSIKVINVRNGEEALEFLDAAVVLPDIIFLDINMPIMNGRSCLKLIKQDRRFNSIPVLIYSTVISPQDSELCHQLGALAYLQKPTSVKQGTDQLSGFLKK